MAFELITHPRGTTFARAYSGFKDENGDAVTDLAGWQFVARLKASLADADNAALLTVATEDWTINSVDGEAGFEFAAADLAAALADGATAYLAVLVKSPAGFVGLLDEALLGLYVTASQSFS